MGAGVTGKAKEKGQREAFDGMSKAWAPEVRGLAKRAREMVLEVMPGAVEIVWPQQKNASYGTGPKKMSEHFVWLSGAKDHLGFGFYYGAELPDPAGLLEGTGKAMRHVKIRSAADLARPALRKLLEQATTHRVPALKD